MADEPEIIKWRKDVDWRVTNLEAAKGDQIDHLTKLGITQKNFERETKDRIRALEGRADQNDRERSAEQRRWLLKALAAMATVVSVLLGIIWNARDAIL